MFVPIGWLKNYTDIDVDINEFCTKMIMSGSNIETVLSYANGIEKIVVGRILSIEKHPNADKLLVTQVDVGNETVQIVTGATNIFEGAIVPVVLDGGVLPDGKVIKKGTLRDVESCGMLCSAKELGLDDKVIPIAHKDGIFILEQDLTPGTAVKEALGLDELTVEFEITPNRPDCLSMLGMARESSAVFGGGLRYPDTTCHKETGQTKDHINLEINKPELCRRYVARVVKDIKIEQSPWWLQKRLITAGMRPINNIVDITNYVMLEYGQPIHAFDLRYLAGGKIVVDTAASGEIFVTLDGSERLLDSDILLIKDDEKAVAIAGIMGGQNSEIQADTTTILIESANFNGDNIRSSSKKLGLRTEASARFEKGIDANLCRTAADRVCKLIEELGAGTVVADAVDLYPTVQMPKPTTVRTSRVNALLGIQLTDEDIERILLSLEMTVELQSGILTITPPTVRQDLLAEIDYVEEIARLYGYDQLPVTLPKGNRVAHKSERRQLRDLTRDTMAALGINEIQTYSFANPKGLDYVNIPADSTMRKYVQLINPLGEENSIMRTTLLPNMMEVLGRNFSRALASVRAFEIGNVFFDLREDPEGLPRETEILTAGIYGQGESFYTLKGVLEELFARLGIKASRFVAEEKLAVYHFGRCATIWIKDVCVGAIGEIHPDTTERYGIDTRVYSCEIDLDKLFSLADIDRYYVPLPKYPAMTRDIALLVEEGINVADIEQIIKDQAGALLESLRLFDVYRGKQVKDGHKSVAFTLTYRDLTKTLTEEEVVRVHNNVLEGLREKMNAVLREI